MSMTTNILPLDTTVWPDQLIKWKASFPPEVSNASPSRMRAVQVSNREKCMGIVIFRIVDPGEAIWEAWQVITDNEESIAMLLNAVESFSRDELAARFMRFSIRPEQEALRNSLMSMGWVFEEAILKGKDDVHERWLLPLFHQPLRCLLIGCNPVGRGGELARLVENNPRLATIVAVCDKSEPALAVWREKGIANASSLDELLAMGLTLDIALLALPHREYPPLRKRCLEMGLTLLHEKPLANSIEEFFELKNLIEQRKVGIVVGVQRRVHPSYVLLKSLLHQVDEKVELMTIDLQLGRSPYPSGWRADSRIAGGGALLDLGYHALDLAHYLLEVTLEPVSCTLWIETDRGRRPIRQGEVETSAVVVGRCGATWVRISVHRTGTKYEQITLQLQGKTITANREGVWEEGQERFRCSGGWQLAESAQLGQLARVYSNPQAGSPDLWEHLASLRVITHAYSLAPALGLGGAPHHAENS